MRTVATGLQGNWTPDAYDADAVVAAKRFEDLIAWQKARLLTNDIYATTRAGALGRDFGLKDQMRRAAVSVMANVAEGFERRSAPDFLRFLTIAKASCAELQSHLYVALDAGYLDSATFDRLFGLARETGRNVGGLQASIARNSELRTRN